MRNFVLTIVTPEKSIVSKETVEGIVLPGSRGQLTLLPGHANLLTSMRHGIFAYLTKGEWQVAYLSGGFTQVAGENVTVLAETMEMAQDLDVAKAELEIQELANKIKTLVVGSPEYAAMVELQNQATSKLQAAKKKIH